MRIDFLINMATIANIDIHIHPFLDRNSIVDIENAMKERKLDVIALEALDSSIYSQVV